MRITPPTSQTALILPAHLSEDYDSLVMDASGLLSDAGREFLVDGFGQSGWAVDVSYDLSSVIEQLPTAINALEQNDSVRIDFYGQGVERVLTFVPAGEVVQGLKLD